MLKDPLGLVLNSVLDLIYPPCCLVCRERIETGALCAICRGGFESISPPFCDRCGAPVAAGSQICPQCVDGSPPYDWSQALGLYSSSLRTAIHRLKYDGKTALARPLGRLLAQSLDNPETPLLFPTHSAGPVNFDLVLPIPLHAGKLRERGFNQAELIAYHLAQERGWQLDAKSLMRSRRTRSQTTLDVSRRAENIRDAFALRGNRRFDGKSVLIVDDVLTTSATVREAARVVRDAGAERVCVIALARG